MIRTLQYRLPFRVQGDLYRASEDLEGMTIIDNQLFDLSGIVGDGTLGGWTISQHGTDCSIEVQPGQGFIDAILNKTLSIKTATVTTDVLTNVYMKSTMPQTGSLKLETESPPSNIESIIYVDPAPPANPTGFAVSTVPPNFDFVNLIWDACGSTNFDHYEIQRGPAVGGPWTVIASPDTNGIVTEPYVDTGLSASTTYFYRLFTVSRSSIYCLAPDADSVTTPLDLLQPAAPGGLTLYPGNTTASVLWDASATVGATYVLTIQELDLDGSVLSTQTINTSALYVQLTGLTNGARYRVTLQSKSTNSVLSDGTVADMIPTSSIAPLDPLLAISATNKELTTGVATITTSVNHGLAIGQTVIVALSPADAVLDGTHVITAVSATTFNYAVTNPDIPSVATLGTVYIEAVVDPQVHAAKISWFPSPSPTGTAVSQKQEYRIVVITNGVASAPIRGIGTALTRSVSSYREMQGANLGAIHTLEENVIYVFKIYTVDAAGNESAGLYVKGSILDITPPKDPRNLQLTPGDTTISMTWKHSLSTDTTSYIINIKTGAVFGPNIYIDYLEKYVLTGLTNGIVTVVKLRAKDTTGNASVGIAGTTTPIIDTTAPAVPSGLNTTSLDQHINIAWLPNTEADLDHYVLKRMSTVQDLLALRDKPLTEATELPTVYAIGNITDVTSATDITVGAFAGLPDQTGRIFVVNSGLAKNKKATITAFDSALGRMTLSPALTVLPVDGDSAVLKATDPSLGTFETNVGTLTNVLDIGLVNGQTYAYWIKAVDTRNNTSAYSDFILAAPTCGNNDLPAPTGLTLSFLVGPPRVIITWNALVPDADHPALIPVPPYFDHTAFNIYRSTVSYGAFTLIDSVDSTVLTYTDTDLINNQDYYYIVTAVRDNADILLDTGAVQPANTVLLGQVQLDLSSPGHCVVVFLENQQRIVDQLEGSIEEETNRRILDHHHSAAITNSSQVTATALLGSIDASTLSAFDFTTTTSLSDSAITYYQNLIKNKNGVTITYDANTTFAISPLSVVGNVPYIGDFQVLINGEKPTQSFLIDEDRNVVVFSDVLTTDSVVSFDGTGFSYYVPALIDLSYRGFDIQVNEITATPVVDEQLQTIRFLSPLQGTDVVVVTIEPVIPVIETAVNKVAKINLSPNLVLADFTTQNGTLFQSESGDFTSTDEVFVLVNGVRTTLNHAVDTTNKTITFDQTIPSTSTVALEIMSSLAHVEINPAIGHELAASRIVGLDASQFTSGKFLKAQLPLLSHEGRVQEQAFPLFQTLTGTDRYNYQAEVGILGSATTPYSVYMFDGGTLLIGTSAGLLKSTGFAAFLAQDEASQTTIDYTLEPSTGLNFQTAQPDQIVGFATSAIPNSGRFNGKITIIKNIGGQILPIRDVYNPSLTLLPDGTVLISGGADYNDNFAAYYQMIYTYIYSPITGVMTQVGDLYQKRWGHTAILLPSSGSLVDGGVLVCGGSFEQIMHLDPSTFTPDWIGVTRLKSAEIYDIFNKTWTPVGDMTTSRSDHSTILINDNEVLVAGGTSGGSEYNGYAYNPPRVVSPSILSTAEIYNITSSAWTLTGSMVKARVSATISANRDSAIVTAGGSQGRELYTRATEEWLMEGTQAETQTAIDDLIGPNSIDSPVKQFLTDSLGGVLLVSGNNVYFTKTGETYVKTKGLESVKTVHRIAQDSNGTLYAATDLGVYEITVDIHDSLTWFQGGVIGAGTTETFDLEPFNNSMLAGTEIGIFFTSDNGDTWTEVIELENIYNIKKAGDVLYANSNQTLYRGDPGYGIIGIVWTKVGVYSFIDKDSKMVIRAPLDMFFTTSYGLYASRDGINFFLVDFDKNRHTTENNVHMATVIGSDLMVGYDNTIIAIGTEFETLLLAEFPGIVPTIAVNDIEQRIGVRYDTVHNMVIFEQKLFAADIIKATSNYGTYDMQYGQWYRNNANAAVTVFVNGKVQDDSTLTLDPRLGRITFATALNKIDIIKATIVGTTLKNEGEFFHSELEDKLEKEKGLPLSLGNDHAGNVLQMGLSVDHNFWERGLDRNQYYCYLESFADRSFTSFLANSEFYIMGRREFDRFNSTIDYKEEAEQLSIGKRSLVPLSALGVSPNLWVGTENGIFILDATSPDLTIIGSIDIEQANNPVRDMQYFLDNIWAVTQEGLYTNVGLGTTFTQNKGEGLPDLLYAFSSLGSLPFVGTNDSIYYSDGDQETPQFSTWYKASFVESGSQVERIVNGSCTALASGDGMAYAGIDRSIYVSTDGKKWSHVFDFAEGFSIFSIAIFAKKLYVGTNQGVYCDDGSSRSATPSFTLQKTDGNLVDSATLSVNQVYASGTDTGAYLLAVGSKGNVYKLAYETWVATPITGVDSIQRIIVVNSMQVAMVNDTLYVQ